VSRDGKDLGTVSPPGMYNTPRLSHDELRLAVDVSDRETAKGEFGFAMSSAACPHV